MNGIHAAFTGRIGKDAEIRATRHGKPWAAFTAVVDDDAPDGVTVRVSAPSPVLGDLAPRLKKGVAFSIEGTLCLRFWVDESGRPEDGAVTLRTEARSREVRIPPSTGEPATEGDGS